MKKKLLAILLVLTMVLGLASCGSKDSGSGDASLSAQIDKMSDMDADYAELSIDVDTDLFKQSNLDITKLSLKIAAQTDKESKKLGKAEISYKLDSGDFTKLTTMIVDDQVIYINLKELKEAATGLIDKLGLSDYASVLTVLPSDEYVKIDPATIAQMTGAEVSSSSLSINEEDTKKIIKMVTEVTKAVEDAIKDVEPAVITGDDDKVAFNLSDKNAKATFEALAKADFSKCFDTVMEQMEAIESFKAFATEYKGKKSDILAELKTTLEDGAKKLTDAKDFALNYTFEISGSEGKRVAEQKFSVNVKDEEASLKMSFTCSAQEGKEEKVEVPAEAADFMTIMSSLMGGMSY